MVEYSEADLARAEDEAEDEPESSVLTGMLADYVGLGPTPDLMPATVQRCVPSDTPERPARRSRGDRRD